MDRNDILEDVNGFVAVAQVEKELTRNEPLKEIHFPLNCFPPELREIIEHYHHYRSFPLDFFAVSILTAAGSAMGNSYVLETPDGYTNRANLYAMIVAQPGINKSHPLDVAYKPILVKQTQMFQQFRAQQVQDKIYRSEQKALAKEAASAAKKSAKCNENADKMQPSNTTQSTDLEIISIESANNAENAGVKFIKPIMQGTTTEALIDQLSNNPHGVTILYDELAGFINSLDKYRKGDDVQLYLSLFQGSHISRDTLTHGTTEIPSPFVSIIGTIQPAELENSFTGKIDNGFFDRFLICYLSNVQKPHPQRQDVNPVIVSKYYTMINNLMELYYNDTIVIGYSDDGYDVIYKWVCASIDRENDPLTSDTERGIRAKMIIYVHRFALILQMLKYGLTKNYLDKKEVSLEACVGATSLADYFLHMAEKTRIRNYGEIVSGQLKRVYDSIVTEDPFTTTEFLVMCQQFEIKKRTASELLKRNVGKLWVKLKHGTYSKIL